MGRSTITHFLRYCLRPSIDQCTMLGRGKILSNHNSSGCKPVQKPADTFWRGSALPSPLVLCRVLGHVPRRHDRSERQALKQAPQALPTAPHLNICISAASACAPPDGILFQALREPFIYRLLVVFEHPILRCSNYDC